MSAADSANGTIVRVLMMPVRPERLAEWLAYTRDVGFPGMLAQPGCRAIFRLRHRTGDPSHAVMTIWDSLAAFEAFKAGPAIAELTRSAAGLTVQPYTELLFDLLPDDGEATDVAGALS